MFRKTALGIAMFSALANGSAMALGLGDIDLKSSLNQPLNAEVALLLVTETELDELRVSLGSREAFNNAGIERVQFLSRIKFDVGRNANGQPVIIATSQDVVREPFLDFLLEISWSKGRLLREYTVLVDPPVTMPAPAPVVQAPAVRAAAPVSVAPVRAVADVQPASVSRQMGEYGPTKRNDTLWKVAEVVRPDSSVSMEQTMLGLLNANPQAFVRKNINNLKAGYVLRVPEHDELTSISRTDALAEVRAQHAAWRSRRASSVAQVPAVTQANSGSGSVSPAVAEPTTVAAKNAGESSLQLVTPDKNQTTSGSTAGSENTAELQAIQQELMMANEALEAQRRESSEINNRLSALEDQIVNMQRLIQLKDDELARLQFRAGEEPVENLVAGDVTEEVVMEQTVDAEAQPDATAEGELPGMDSVVVDETVTAINVPQAPENTEKPVVAQTPVVESAQTVSYLEQFLTNPMWMGGAGVVLALLAFFGLRRKREAESEFQESILTSLDSRIAEGDQAIAAMSATDSTPSAVQSSLLSEFAVSDMGAVRNSGEADPLAEADVYLAYGRYQQAEDLMREALSLDPEHEGLNLKLLEVYLATKNQPDFDQYAQDILARQGDSNTPLWEKVAEMGRELSPENTLYHEGGIPQSVEEESDELHTFIEDADQVMDAIDNTLTDDSSQEFDMDFSFESDNTDSTDDQKSDNTPGTESIEPSAVEADNLMEFDLDSFESLAAEASDDEVPAGDGQLADLDEVSTKLDLARAYIDMGDPDGAKSILSEVADEGSDTQKSEAREILENMAS